MNDTKNLILHSAKSEILTISEAAEFLRISIPALRAKIHRKQLPYIKSGRRIFFLKSSLLDWLKSQEVPSMVQIQEQASEHIEKRKAQFSSSNKLTTM